MQDIGEAINEAAPVEPDKRKYRNIKRFKYLSQGAKIPTNRSHFALTVECKPIVEKDKMPHEWYTAAAIMCLSENTIDKRRIKLGQRDLLGKKIVPPKSHRVFFAYFYSIS